MLILRIVVGLTLAAHGAQKMFGWFEGPRIAGFTRMLGALGMKPAPLWAWVASLAELGGGLLIALGLLWPLGPLAGIGSMLVAIVSVHWSKGFFSTKGGIEFPLVMLASMLAIAIAGAGRFALDALVGFRVPEPLVLLIGLVLVVLGAAGALVSRSLPAPASQPELG